MAKQILVLVVIVLIVGGGYFFLNFEVQPRLEGGKPAGWKIIPKSDLSAASRGALRDGEVAPPRQIIRIATFDLDRLDEAKLAGHRVSDVLVQLIPHFDLMALQGVRGKNQGVLVNLVERVNAATGRSFDFATCPTQQRDALEHYNAFLFDTGRIDADRSTIRFVEDPLGRIRIKPLAGLFRARGPDPAEAFTFILINAKVDSERVADELDVLAAAYRAVRDAHKEEDDIILLGNLETDDQHLGGLGGLLGVGALLSRMPTTVRGDRLVSNILLNRRATAEFNGRITVLDMMGEFALTQPGAQAISSYLPVWAEFGVYEGFQPGSVSVEP